MKKYGKITALIAGVVLALGFASCKANIDDDSTFYTVTFNSMGGTEVLSQSIESGKKATKPADPTKQETETEAFVFAGWYISTDSGTTLSETAFDFNTAITDNITLYAKWTVNAVTHTVTFDTKGGSTSPAEQTIVHGNKATKPADPTKQATETETYTFDNWYTSTDGGVTLSETAFDFDTAISDNITLYAKWTVNAVTHTVTFDTKGGSMSPAEQTIVHGNKATKPADPTKEAVAAEAYTFDNWYTSTDGGATLSETAFDFDTAITDNITLYAKWNVYTEYIELKDCSAIHTMFETLCEYNNNYVRKFNKTITRFAKADARPEVAENYIDAAGNQIPLWYDVEKTTLYYYLGPGKKMTLMTSDGKNSLFKYMSDAVYIETGDFDTSKVTDMSDMFYECQALTSLDVSKFDTSNVTNMSDMFYECQALTSLDVSNFDTSKVTSMYYMFSGCNALTSLDVSKFDTSKVTNMGYMFCWCKALTSLDVSKFDTSNVTNMGAMFDDCEALTSLDVSKFDTSKVTDMCFMFDDCEALTSLDLSSFVTSKVTYMGCMFSGCYALTSLDVSKFDTSKVTDMSNMFSGCYALTSLDVSKFDTSNVIYMGNIFKGCQALTSLDVSSFDTSKVTDMSDMFSGCYALTSLDLSKFDTSKVTDMVYMFSDCEALITITASEKFVTDNVTYYSIYMFENCTSLKGGAGTVYDENHIDKEYARIDGGTEEPGYFTKKQ